MGTANRKKAEIPGEEEHPSPGHSLGVSGELEPEDGSSSAPCLLLLQGVQIFHIFCKRAVLDITGSLIRRKPAHCSAFKGKYPGARGFPLHSDYGRNYSASPAGHCQLLPVHLLLAVSWLIYKL